MKINKLEALALTKTLHPHVGFTTENDSLTEYQEILQDLSERLDHFLTCDDSEHVHEEDDGDDRPEDDDSEEIADDDDDDEEEEEGDSVDVEEELESESVIDPAILHDLASVKTTKGLLEFEDTGTGKSIDILVDGYTEIEGVTHFKRKAKELHVRDASKAWTVFHVTKFPSSWTKTLPVDELVEVLA